MADLRSAPLRILGRLVDASNATLLCELEPPAGDDPTAARVVYKPIRGEIPLWDFPDGTLAGREVASYLVSDRLGWHLIPPTVMREGPVGAGMVQRWVEPPDEPPSADPVEIFDVGAVPDGYLPVFTGLTEDPAAREGYREIVLAHADTPELHRLAVLDVLLNNADRKGGHILTGTVDDCAGPTGASPAPAVYGIDHGICLHTEPKLRTVLWGWSGRPVPTGLLADVERLATELDGDFGYLLRTLITADEVAALAGRARKLLDDPTMPPPPASRAIPWPPF